MSDSVRDRVERAEDSIYQGFQFPNIKEAQEFVVELMTENKEWWDKHFNGITTVTIEKSEAAGPKTPNKNYGIKTQMQGDTVILSFSSESKLQEFPIVANIARMMFDKETFESKAYRSLVLAACSKLLDEQFTKELRDAYSAEGLDF